MGLKEKISQIHAEARAYLCKLAGSNHIHGGSVENAL
jgi:hypothetical protein